MTGRLLTASEAAEFLNVPLTTLTAWRYKRTGPKWIRVGRHVRYRPSDLDAWLDGQEGRERGQ